MEDHLKLQQQDPFKMCSIISLKLNYQDLKSHRLIPKMFTHFYPFNNLFRYSGSDYVNGSIIEGIAPDLVSCQVSFSSYHLQHKYLFFMQWVGETFYFIYFSSQSIYNIKFQSLFGCLSVCLSDHSSGTPGPICLKF